MHIATTDTGGTVVLSKGSAAQGIIASAAIPAAFAPVQHGDPYLADGAVSSNTAVKVAVAQGAKRLIVCPPPRLCPRQPSGRSGRERAARIDVACRAAIVERLDGSIDFFVLPPLCPRVGSPHDFCQTSDLIEMAATSTEAGIAAGGLDRPGVLAQLGTHEQASQARAPSQHSKKLEPVKRIFRPRKASFLEGTIRDRKNRRMGVSTVICCKILASI